MTTFNRLLPFSTSRRSSSPIASTPGTTYGGRPSTYLADIAGSHRSAGRKPRGSRPGLECMEDRTMMSNIPVYGTMGAVSGYALYAQVAPMEQTVVKGSFTPTTPQSYVEVPLQAGEIFTAGLDVNYPAIGTNWGSTLKVYDPFGNQVASQSTSFFSSVANDPITGAGTYDDSVAFRATTTGYYTLEADENTTYASYFGQGNYTMTLRPIELDNSTLHPDANPQDAAKLAFAGGGLYAFLDSNADTLTFSGPTGRGFSIAGQFSEQTTPIPGTSLSTSTITSTGTITLESGLGNIPIPLPPGFDLQVTTLSNGYKGLFGEVNTAQITFPGESILSDITNPFGTLLGPQVQQANSELSQFSQSLSVPGLDLGLGLGGQVDAAIPGAPADPAVPYLYLTASSGVSYGLGTAGVSVLGYRGSVVVDPADASLYVDVQGLPGLPDVALGISQNGYLPFTPAVTPSNFAGRTLYGDFYTNATLNLADLSADMVPFFVNANVVVNLDTSGGGWTNSIRSEATALSQGNLYGAVPNLSTFAIGVNFTGGVSLSLEEVAAISIPLAGGTFIYNGPTSEIDVSATTALNPFQNTPISFLDSATPVSIDAYFNTSSGNFSIKLDTGFSLFGYQLADANVDFTNSGITYTSTTSFLGIEADVFGSIGYDGSANIAGAVYVLINDNLTYDGWGFTVFVSTNIHFDIQNGVLQDWGSGWVSIAFYGAGCEWWSYNGSFNTYDEVSVGSFSIWTIIEDAENIW